MPPPRGVLLVLVFLVLTSSSFSMCWTFSCTSSMTKTRLGVWRMPVWRPTSLRITPLALSRAAALAVFSSGVPNTV